MITRLKLFLGHNLGFDKDVLWITINKTIGILKGPILILFLINYLTPEEQGTWYTFINLSALTVFAELGFTTIITQFVSHQFATLTEVNGKIEGESTNRDHLFGLIQFAIKFYLIVIPIAIFILWMIGFFYFNKRVDEIYFAWVIFSISGGIFLFINLLQSIYQGLDKIEETNKNSVVGSLSVFLLYCISLTLHLKIWALVISNLLGTVIMCISLYRTAPFFWKQISDFKKSVKYNFFRETFSLQWRYAISWASAYFITSLYVPATYKYIGEIEAGQLGLTLSLLTIISQISSAWVFSKIPKFNILVSQKKIREMDTLYFKSVKQAFIIQLVVSFGLLGSLFIMEYSGFFKGRLLNATLTGCLLFAQFAQSLINYSAVYLRSHKEEPMIWISVLNASLSIILVLLILPNFGLEVFLISTSAIVCIIILPLALNIFHSRKTNYILNTN